MTVDERARLASELGCLATRVEDAAAAALKKDDAALLDAAAYIMFHAERTLDILRKVLP